MSSTPGISILVVDDEPEICEILRRMLSRSGVEAMVAHGRVQASACLAAGRFDAVLSDLRMPDGHGLELLKETRARLGELCPPFFFITGFSEISEDELKVSGAMGVFNKPFERKEITERLIQAAEAFRRKVPL